MTKICVNSTLALKNGGWEQNIADEGLASEKIIWLVVSKIY